MNSNPLNIGAATAPRYEFRTFGHNFNKSHEMMMLLTQPVPEDLQVRIFDENYIISKTVDDINIKIKNNLLDVKKLVRTKGITEQWNSVGKYKFPISKEFLLEEIAPELQVAFTKLEYNEFSIERIADTIKYHKDLLYIPVQKRRYTYVVHNTICEFAEVVIDNDYLLTISVESLEYEEVIRTVSQLKLNQYENINYPQAIKRVKGINSKSLAN